MALVDKLIGIFNSFTISFGLSDRTLCWPSSSSLTGDFLINKDKGYVSIFYN